MTDEKLPYLQARQPKISEREAEIMMKIGSCPYPFRHIVYRVKDGIWLPNEEMKSEK